MTKRTKYVALIAGLAVIAVVVIAAVKKGNNQATLVREEKVAKRDLIASVTASGQVEPHTKVDVASDVSGRITQLSVKEGQMVTKGQFLLQIDPSTYQADVQRNEAAVAAARADYARAKANLDQSKSSLHRSEEISQTNTALISAEQLEQLKTTVDVNQALFDAAKHSIDQAEAALKNSKSLLAKTTINAPMSGQITRLAVEQGETAVPGTFSKDQALLLTISDMSDLETKVKVDETDVARISVGDSSTVEIGNSAILATGATTTTSDQAVDYYVKVRLLNPPRDTRPDYSATAKVITDTRTNVLSIPIIALTVREHQSNENKDSAQVVLGKKATKDVGKRDVEGVFVIGKDNKVAFRPVKIGIAGEEYFEVLSGLQEGEQIVSGSFQAIRELKEGTTVREQPAPKKDASKTPVKT